MSKRKMKILLSFYCDEEFRKKMKEQAGKLNLSISEFIRNSINNRIERLERKEKKEMEANNDGSI